MSALTRRFHRSALALAVLSTGCAATPDQVEDTDETTSAITREGGGGDPNPALDRCLTESRGSLVASPASVPLGASTTLTWAASIPSRCPTVKIYFDADIVALNGSRVITPLATSVHRLRASIPGYGEREIKAATIGVQLPPVVHITSNDQVPTFVQAVQTVCETVEVANGVQLDLSNRENIPIAEGVLVYGGRRGREPGPRLFTTTRPEGLFRINAGASKVRLTGLRIEGPDMGVPDPNDSSAIKINSAIGVEIDNNEIFGWASSAIDVKDESGTASSPSPSESELPAHTVNIHDNFIHHNQAEGNGGYGIVVGQGGHPLIQRNVFDYNRHAIAGDGRPGTGYTALYNLVLENGGRDEYWTAYGWTHTHQFDMHGRGNCGVRDLWSDSLWNCGPAGHTMIIRHNAFFYTESSDIKLRGTPEVGMFVGANVFSTVLLAAVQEESGLHFEPDNELGYNGKNELGSCDFDGDGVVDSFMATGQSWWYRSGTTGPWQFLNPSTKKLSEVSIGHFDGDNRCDVKVDGVVHPGGRPPSPWRPPTGDLPPLTSMTTMFGAAASPELPTTPITTCR